MTIFSRLSIRKSDHSLPHREGGGWIFSSWKAGGGAFPRGGWEAVFFSILLLASCSGSDNTLTAEEQARRDSAALHVAVMPVHDCLPLYWAEHIGIFDSLDVDIRLHTLQAQLDIDTALSNRRVMMGYSDLIRAIMLWQSDTCSTLAIAATTGDLDLITPRRGRIRTMAQLRERMVAVARHSITDYWSDRLTDTAAMERDAIFRPQINDVHIRTAMLINGTMDAAFLPEPYASQMAVLGAKRHLSTRGLSPHLAAFIIKQEASRDTARMEQIRRCLQAYDTAARRLNDIDHDSLSTLLRDVCHLPDTLIDTIARCLPPFDALTPPRKSDADEALRWIRERGRLRQDLAVDSLITDIAR